MHHLLQATRKAIADENWYAALTLALSLPDICGRLDHPTKKSQDRFEAWFRKYALDKFQIYFGEELYTFLDASDCYALRCAYLHQGEFGIEDQRARKALSRVTFRVPNPQDASHLISNGKVLHLKVDMFCESMCAGVEAWIREMDGIPDVQERLARLGRIAQ